MQLRHVRRAAIMNTVQSTSIEDDPTARQAVANSFEQHAIPVCAVAVSLTKGEFVLLIVATMSE